ncbi:FadR family transcriptional regulator [Neisseria sp. Dent CA1/247]|uniref:FadR/GntR family transcriptional regulator n=1 Tax=Neisseria sp. Dent CA1/247 TaxID=2912675 RepID=UPI001FD32AF4|nr:FadR/GntR family transcriptional regulator [Neisseria sp. Dent CA1/247]UOO77723.1 FadR family transcriptional regulator [Neisseria sp. Dent CA1/247]
MQPNTSATVRLPGIGAQIASILEERILQNVYPIGSKLPPERVLAEEFGVSRQSLRSALRILSVRGMLQTRQGDGHYVSGRIEKNFQYGWEDLIDKNESMESEVLDFRRNIEGMLAALAAQRRTEADLARMRSWLDKLREAYAQNNLDLQSAADVGFHQAVAEAAHNIMFTRLSDGLLRLLTGQTKRNLANMFGVPDIHRQLTAQHEAIFKAIKQQNAAEAMQAAHRHLDYVQNSLNFRREQQLRESVSLAQAAGDARKPGFK